MFARTTCSACRPIGAPLSAYPVATWACCNSLLDAAMGCANSKPPADPAPPSETPAGGNDDKYDPASGLPKSKVPPTADEAMNDARHSQVRESRLSVRYQAKEMSSGRVSSRRSSAPFDRSRIGTHTRHGIMPGPRGFSAAKINQDRGVVCWPFNGSYNQALLCIFDGHGSKGEKASEFCMTTVPELLEADTDLLMKDVPAALHKNIVLTDEKLLGGACSAATPLPRPPASRARAR